MANRDLNKAERETLESLIDAADVPAVLMALSEICGEKAEHIRETWQDMPLARKWDSAAGVIGCLVSDRHIAAIADRS